MNHMLHNMEIPHANERTILLVDDNATNIKVLVNLLESYGLTVLIARDGATALETAGYALPDLILLDIMMPHMDGFETCQRLKTNPRTKDIPIIFMTALNGIENKVKGLQVGAVDYVTKPLQHAEVIARITTHLKIRDLTQSLQKQNEWLMKLALQQDASYQIGQRILSLLDLDVLLVTVVDLIQSKFKYDFIGLWLISATQDSLTLQASASSLTTTNPPLGTHISLQSTSLMIIDAYLNRQTRLVDNIQSTPYSQWDALPITCSQLSLPLRFGNDMLGMIDIHTQQVASFDSQDKMVMQGLANQIAVAIRNAQRYSKSTPMNDLPDKIQSHE